MLIAVLHFIPDEDDPYKIVARLMDAVPPGSCLVLAHGASDIQPDVVAEMMRRYNALSSVRLTLRAWPEVTRFFDGLELIPWRGAAPAVGSYRPGRPGCRERPGRLLRHRLQELSGHAQPGAPPERKPVPGDYGRLFWRPDHGSKAAVSCVKPA